MGAAPPPAPLLMEPSPVETAWERGLREAKEVGLILLLLLLNVEKFFNLFHFVRNVIKLGFF